MMPEGERKPAVAAIVLAAGAARRMQGQQKLLLPLGQKPLLVWVLETLLPLPFAEIVVVRRSDSQLETVLASFPVRTVENPMADSGMASSIRIGVRAISQEVSGFLLVLGDMPKVRRETYEQLLGAHQRFPNRVIVPRYQGQRGNPVLFPASYRSLLLQLSGDVGARGLLQQESSQLYWLEVEDPGILFDVDTVEDYRRLVGQRSL